ncbi:MAG TPA: FmdB family zinc ribbon protein [Ktedonobacterales bacterium]
MPLYEFYCADCRGKFEVLTSYERSLSAIACTTCEGTNVRKLLSVVARPRRNAGDDGDWGDFGGDDYEGESGSAGGCGCGGACSCGMHD